MPASPRHGAHLPRVGIVGGGQLARMLFEAALRLDLEVRALARASDTSLAPFGEWVTIADPDEPGALEAFAATVDVVTFEHELQPLETLEALEAAGVPLRPSAAVLRMADKAHQRLGLAEAGIPVPPFAVVTDPAGVEAFAADHGWPVVVKSATGGYDGRGVFTLDSAAALAADLGPEAWADGTRFVVEPHLDIDVELAALIARRPDGTSAAFPVVETVQRRGMCREVLVPPRVPAAVAAEARRIGEAVADTIDAVGVLAVELFVVDDGVVLVNELAPRVHNSGHLTIEACRTSQFEQHLRAVAGLPLGSTELLVESAAMANVVGDPAGIDPRDRLGSTDTTGAAVHLYGKAPRPERKIGHVTVCGHDPVADHTRAATVAADLTAPEDGRP